MSVIARNLAALAASQLASWSVTLLFVVVVPRYLSDAQYGQVVFSTSFVGIFGLIAGFGMTSFIVKAVARDQSSLGLYVSNALAMQLPLVLVMSGGAFLVAELIGKPPEMLLLVGVACFGMALSVLSGTVVAGLQGEQRMSGIAFWAAAQGFLAATVLLFVMLTHRGIVVLALALAATGAVSLVANGARIWPRLRTSLRVDLRVWQMLIAGGLPFLIWNLALTVYGSIDITMLSIMAGDAVVGWYALAYKFVGVPMFFPTMIITAFFPTLSAEGLNKSPIFVGLANRALCAVYFFSAPMALGTALVARQLVTLFHYPAPFAHSVPLIQILALHIPIVGLDTVLAAALMACDRQKSWAIAGCAAAVLNPLANLVAIPMTARAVGDGAIGAAVVTIMTEVFMFAVALYLRPAHVLDGRTVSYALRCTAACLPMVAIVLAAGQSSLVIRVALGAVAYGGASIALRTLSLPALYHAALMYLSSNRLRRAAGIG